VSCHRYYAHRVQDAPYRIVTKRLVLRCYDLTDAPLLKAAIDGSLEHLRAWMPWAYDDPVPLGQMAERLRRFRANFDLGEQYVYGMFTPDEHEVVGGTGLHKRVGDAALEIGYWLRADQLRRGLATEAASALTRAAFDICLVERMEIHADARNTASLGVPRRLGYREEGTLRRRLPSCPPDAPRGDVTIFSLLEEEFRASPLAAFPLHAYDAAGERVL
jgi:RimJ/RimL family protein N-acetyltransferase